MFNAYIPILLSAIIIRKLYPKTDKSNFYTKTLDISPKSDYNISQSDFGLKYLPTRRISLDNKNNRKKLYEYNNVLKKLVDKSIAAEYRLLTDTDHAFSLSGRYIDNSFYGDALTVRASGAYRLSPNFRVHGSIGTATQTPTMDEYFGYAPWQQPNFDLKPEKSFGGDVGLLVESTDKKHSLDITYFARNVKNFIAYNNNWTQMINLDGTTKVKGIELAYNGQLSEKLSSYANYTYTRAKDAKHLELIRRPKHAANVGLSYQITEQLGSSVSISYVGKRIDSGRYKMPSYTLANLGVNYQINKHINVYANLNNVFNKKYENLVGYGQDGRNVYVGLKGSF